MSEVSKSFKYESNATFAELAEVIVASQRIAVTTHSKPDGDAMGSVLAMVRTLTKLGKVADAWLMGPVENALTLIAEDTPFHLVEDHMPGDDYDLIIITDTGAWTQLDPLADWLKRNQPRVIGFDHHTGGQDVASKRIVDAKKCSATHLLVELIDELGVELDGARGGIAEALFVGMATDTGWFKFQNANAECFATASRLLATGIDKSRLYQLIEETAAPSRLALEGRALTSLQFARNGEVAIMSLSPGDFKETGGSPQDLTGIVNQPMQVGSVRVSVLLTQVEAGLTKISFRSKPAINGGAFTDVNELAGRMGGGGHIHAAGAKLKMDLQQALQVVLKEL